MSPVKQSPSNTFSNVPPYNDLSAESVARHMIESAINFQ